MLDLLYPVDMANYDPNQKSGILNPGGGMPTKLLSVIQVLSKRYIVNLIDTLADQRNDIIIIEPLTPRLLNQDFGEWLTALRACPAKKILFCSEMEVSRWAPNTLKEILEAVDIVTANTKYQERLIRTLSRGECLPVHLCDPIDASLFRPAHDKKLRVFSAGRVSKDKNSHFLIDVFKKVKSAYGDLVETAYFGSANLWGHETAEDLAVQRDIEACVDFYEGGVSRNYLAALFGESLIFIAKSKHDVYSSTHVEVLASGCISVAGGHPLYGERPGVSGLSSVYDFVEAIGDLLESPQDILTTKAEESRDYVLEHCGFDAFLAQFQTILEALI